MLEYQRSVYNDLDWKKNILKKYFIRLKLAGVFKSYQTIA